MPNQYQLPLDEEQQAALLADYQALTREMQLARRKLQNLDKTNKFLATMNENAERIRDKNEQDLRKMKQQAEEASVAKSAFLAQMSHEMRTPMNAIKVLSELLLRTELDQVQKDYAQNLVNSSVSLLNIINDILDFSKLESQKFEISTVVYDLPSLLDDVANLINLRALDKNLIFTTEIDGNIPTMLEGDDLRIKQIMLNILQNAVKYTKQGTINLALSMEPGAQEDTVILRCSVKDSGIGISEEGLQQLFQPFSQLDRDQNRATEGTGLGLTITKDLLQLMGGDIWVTSQYGQGSTFSFCLPQRVVDATPLAYVADSADKRVLCAGGEIKRQAVRRMCESLGITADEAKTEAEFRALVRQNQYTHIIYRYELFNSTVTELAEELRDTRLISVKHIRYAGQQQTPASTAVLFEPILIHEISKLVQSTEAAPVNSFDSDVAQIGSFSVRDVQVLIVDDNDVNLMVMNQLLNQYEMDSVLAKSGLAAIEAAAQQPFDLIFMDHMMPGMNGVEAAKRIRAEEGPNQHTPIIVVTANAIVGMREEFLREGMDDYISKPIEIKELNTVLQRWLPQEKLVYQSQPGEAAAGGGAPQSGNALFLQELMAFGIDSLEICESMSYNADTYLAILDTFTSSLPDTLEKLYQALQRQDIEAFGIHVHGVKSALANIGAGRLSKRAEKLEQDAKQQNLNAIKSDFPPFADKLSQLLHNIESVKPQAAALNGDAPAAQTNLTGPRLRELLQQLQAYLEELDSITALDSLAELVGQMSQSQQQALGPQIQEIRTNIENFDYDAAIQQIHHLAEQA